ncbi:MAG: hypothetical protein MHM6MM_005390 [Cercozoa sp. M6MM]
MTISSARTGCGARAWLHVLIVLSTVSLGVIALGVTRVLPMGTLSDGATLLCYVYPRKRAERRLRRHVGLCVAAAAAALGGVTTLAVPLASLHCVRVLALLQLLLPLTQLLLSRRQARRQLRRLAHLPRFVDSVRRLMRLAMAATLCALQFGLRSAPAGVIAAATCVALATCVLLPLQVLQYCRSVCYRPNCQCQKKEEFLRLHQRLCTAKFGAFSGDVERGNLADFLNSRLAAFSASHSADKKGTLLLLEDESESTSNRATVIARNVRFYDDTAHVTDSSPQVELTTADNDGKNNNNRDNTGERNNNTPSTSLLQRVMRKSVAGVSSSTSTPNNNSNNSNNNNNSNNRNNTTQVLDSLRNTGLSQEVPVAGAPRL